MTSGEHEIDRHEAQPPQAFGGVDARVQQDAPLQQDAPVQSAARVAPRRRWPGILLYVVLGVLVGVMGSFTHRARFDAAVVTIWFGIVVAVVCVLAFAIGLRATSSDRLLGYGFAAGVTAGVVAIAAGFDHSAVVLGDAIGTAWLLLATIPPFAVAFWPRLAPRERAASRPTPHVHPVQPPHSAQGYPGSQAPDPLAAPPSHHVPPKEPQQ